MSIKENLIGFEIECGKCKIKIGKNNFKKHYNSCDGSGIPKKKRRNNGKGQGYHRGKTYIEIFGVEKANKIKSKISEANSNRIPHEHTEEEKRNLSNKMLGNKNWINSINKSGKGKKGYINGEYFMSTWEMAYIIYCKDNSIEYRRNWEMFEYYDNGIKRYYIPDFFLIKEKKFIEVKGYVDSSVAKKIESFKYDIELLDKNKMKPILEYVINKYGKNFYEILKD